MKGRAAFKDDPIDYLIGCFINTIGGIAILGFVIYLCVGVYQGLDNSGWIRHSRNTTTFFRSDWLASEYKNCTTYSPTSILDCDYRGAASPPMRGGDLHELPVTYHGRIDRTDHSYFTWRCQRSEKGLECWALD